MTARFILSILSLLAATSSAWPMENPQESTKKESIIIVFNDKQELEISRHLASQFNVLKNFMLDLEGKADNKIYLPEAITLEQWNDIANLFNQIKPALTQPEALAIYKEAVIKLSLDKLLSLLNSLEYLDPSIAQTGAEAVNGMPTILASLEEKIIAEPGIAIPLLKYKYYPIPSAAHPHIARALLIAKNIFYKPFSSAAFIEPERDDLRIAWAPDGRLGVFPMFGNSNVRIIDLNGEITRINPGHLEILSFPIWSPQGRLALISMHSTGLIVDVNKKKQVLDLKDLGLISAVAWLPEEHLLITGQHGFAIIFTNGDITKVMTEIGFLSGSNLAPNGRIALLGSQGYSIFEPDGQITPINTEELGQSSRPLAAWSPSSRLAVKGANGIGIINPDGTMMKLKKEELRSINPKAMAWLPGEILALMGKDTICLVTLDKKITLMPLKELGDLSNLYVSSTNQLIVIGQNGNGIITPDNQMNIIISDHVGVITEHSLAPDGIHLALVGNNGLCIVNVNTGHRQIYLVGNIFALAWAASGQLALASQHGTWILTTDGNFKPLNTKKLGKVIEQLAWARDGRLAIIGERGIEIYYPDIPEEYNHLSIDQALLIIKRATYPEDTLTADEKALYASLDQKIKDKYPLHG